MRHRILLNDAADVRVRNVLSSEILRKSILSLSRTVFSPSYSLKIVNGIFTAYL